MWPVLCKPGICLVIERFVTSGNMINGNHTMENVREAIRDDLEVVSPSSVIVSSMTLIPELVNHSASVLMSS